MNLLAAKLYDPAVAVTKATTALLAMTVIDAVNLRLAITVPAHGMVRFRLACAMHGAATMAQILLGVMNGAAILGRVPPTVTASNLATTTLYQAEAEFTVSGLAPGAMNVDAAYSVETLLASTGIKYGGPNNTTANDAFGGFVFEAWDPQPQTANSTLAVDANGRVDVSKVAGTAQTARDLGAQLDAAVTTRAAATTALSTATWTNGRAANLDNLDAAVSTRSVYAGADTGGTTTLLGRLTAGRAAGLDNLDVTVSSRLSAGGYTAPDNAGIATAAAAAAAAAVDTGVIRAKTDSLNFTVAGHLDVNSLKINGVTVQGTGVAGDLWRG